MLALVFAFAASLGVVALPSEAQAGRRNVWSVKFKCSQDDGNTNFDELVDLPYIDETNEFVVFTTVNIHNPTDRTVDFNKKVVIVEPQHVNSTTKVSDKDGITLGANKAHNIDCKDIHKLFKDSTIDPDNFEVEEVYEGWVVIESEKGKKIPDLAVCANYFAAVWDTSTDKGGGTSAQTLCYKPIRVRFTGDFKLF